MPSAQLPRLQPILLRHSPNPLLQSQLGHKLLTIPRQCLSLSQQPHLRAQRRPYSTATTTSVSKRLSGQHHQPGRIKNAYPYRFARAILGNHHCMEPVMPDRSLFNHPFHEQPTDDPVTGPAARCNKLIAASIHRSSTHLMCQRSNIASFSHAFGLLARLLSAARGALSRRLLGRGRVIPISIN